MLVEGKIVWKQFPMDLPKEERAILVYHQGQLFIACWSYREGWYIQNFNFPSNDKPSKREVFDHRISKVEWVDIYSFIEE